MRIYCWIAGAMLLAPTVGAAADDEIQTVTIRGETYEIWPSEDLVARGLEVEDSPRERNAFWMYLDAINAYDELPKPLSEAFDYATQKAWPENAAALADYLQTPGTRRAFALTQRAAAIYRYHMPYFGNPEESVVSILLPNLSYYRFLGKLHIADGRRLAAGGDYDAASRRIFSAMSLGEHAAQGNTLIEGLVGIAVYALANRTLVDLVLRHDLSTKQLLAIQRELNKRAARVPTVRRGMRSEQHFGPAIVDEICARPSAVIPNIRAFGDLEGAPDLGKASVNANPKDGWGRLEKRVGQLFFPDRSIKRHMADYYDKIVARAESPLEFGRTEDFDESQYMRTRIPSWDVVSRMLLPSLSRATLLGERAKADLALLRAVVAVRLHMSKQKALPPPDLETIIEELPEGALLDPFSGNAVRYLTTDDGWIVYSVGPNGIDDGGVKGERWEDHDIVIQYPKEDVAPFGDDKNAGDGD